MNAFKSIQKLHPLFNIWNGTSHPNISIPSDPFFDGGLQLSSQSIAILRDLGIWSPIPLEIREVMPKNQIETR